MKRQFTKYPSKVAASTDVDYKKLQNKIRVAVWDGICEYIENLSFDEIPNADLKQFYTKENIRTNQILRDLDKLSEDVAKYFVEMAEEPDEE